jgi:hypothetical protein
MEEPHGEGPPPIARASLVDAIRGSALGLLIGGGICLFFGFTLLIDAPGSASEEATETWFAIDRVFQWALRIVGVVFLIAAAWAMTGQRRSMLLGTISEVGFCLLMLAMAVETTLEARADGGMDAFAILYAILFVIGLSGVKRSWVLYRGRSTAW